MMKEVKLDEFVRTPELAKKFGVRHQTIRNWIRNYDGEVKVIRMPKFFLIHKADFEKCITDMKKIAYKRGRPKKYNLDKEYFSL